MFTGTNLDSSPPETYTVRGYWQLGGELVFLMVVEVCFAGVAYISEKEIVIYMASRIVYQRKGPSRYHGYGQGPSFLPGLALAALCL